MLVPRSVEDDLGAETAPTTTFLRYEVELGFEAPVGQGSLGRLVLLREELRHITRGGAPGHLRFEHSARRFWDEVSSASAGVAPPCRRSSATRGRSATSTGTVAVEAGRSRELLRVPAGPCSPPSRPGTTGPSWPHAARCRAGAARPWSRPPRGSPTASTRRGACRRTGGTWQRPCTASHTRWTAVVMLTRRLSAPVWPGASQTSLESGLRSSTSSSTRSARCPPCCWTNGKCPACLPGPCRRGPCASSPCASWWRTHGQRGSSAWRSRRTAGTPLISGRCSSSCRTRQSIPPSHPVRATRSGR